MKIIPPWEHLGYIASNITATGDSFIAVYALLSIVMKNAFKHIWISPGKSFGESQCLGWLDYLGTSGSSV